MKNNLIFLIIFSLVIGQENKSITFQANEFEKTSWWSENNNNGIKSNDSYFTIFYNKEFKSYNLFSTTYFNNKEFIVGESFIDLRMSKNFSLKLGRYYRDFSKYLNDDISSGSMLISTNALPMPKVGLMGKFSPKSNTKLRFDYGISHAILDSNSIYKKAPYIHEKFIYLKSKHRLEFGVGLVHEAIWAGATYSNGKFGDTFNDFLKIIISADDKLQDGQTHSNALGNHLGIWDFYIIKNSKNNSLKVYYQHFFEDTSGLRFANRIDGLWGFEFIDKVSKTNYLIEYLSTSNQDRDPPYVNDAYYNHFEYSLGWSYNGKVIGNPFIDNLNPNPLEVIHLGMKTFKENKLQLKILLSRRIDFGDDIKYSVNVGRKFDKIFFQIFLNGEKETNLGFRLTHDI